MCDSLQLVIRRCDYQVRLCNQQFLRSFSAQVAIC